MTSNGTEATNGTATSKKTTTCSHMNKLMTVVGSRLEEVLLKVRARHAPGQGDDDDSKRLTGNLSITYGCLQCPESGNLSFISSHSKKEKHRISLDLRSGYLYCASCKDILYDPTAEQMHFYGSVPSPDARKRKFSETLESDPYITTNSSATPCSRDGVRGLFNLGQTCYMNSIVQSMLHDPLLVSYFLGEGHSPHKCDIEDCIGCAMTEIFSECRSTDRQDGYAALSLLLASWKQIPSLAGYAQQDAHEYYQAIVDKLHESVTVHRSYEGHCKCFFHKAFFGRLRSTITCSACGEKRKTDDPMNDLNLHMEIQQAAKKKEKVNGASGEAQRSAPTLASCLDSFTAKEKLMANCKNCGNTQKPATKQLKLRKLPAILCMQMKRFDTRNPSESTKIEGKVDFPLTLDMTPYTTSHPATYIPSSKSDKNGPDPVTHTQRFLYDLTSVIVHKGSLDSGHYYAYCRETATPPVMSDSAPLPATQESWYCFNDDRVTLVSVKDVLAADAYLLFYGLRWLPPRDPNRPPEPPVVRYKVDEESDSD